MASLYQKYRPQRFSELVGQDWISKILRKVISEGKQAHAYLFTGARGTGKTSTARIVAKSLNCLNPKDGEPCNECANCIAINEGRFLDLFEIDAASNRGIDQIRELKEKINFSPSQGKYKVYIIDEVHMLTNEAFNALLKTLEEPPVHTVFMLATTEPHKIPLTIISRTQRFDFKLANEDDLKQKLNEILSKEERKMDDKALEIVIQGASGSFRDSETILDKVLGSADGKKEITEESVRTILGLSDQKAVEEMMAALLSSDINKALEILNETNNKGLSLYQFLKQILEFGRILIYNKIVSKKSVLNIDFDLKKLVKVIKILTDATYQIKTAVVPILAFEIAIVDICIEDAAPVEVKMQPQTVATSTPKIVKEEVNFKPKEEVKAEEIKTEKPQTVEEEIMVLEPEVQIEVEIKNEDKEDAPKSEATFEEFPLADISLVNVTSVWSQFLEKVRPHNFHLQAFLSKAQPTQIIGDKLILKVPFKFHKMKIEAHESRKVISELFKGLINVALIPTCEVSEDLRVEEPEQTVVSNEDLVQEIFGDLMENEAEERDEKVE